jgi:hypothetical protein
MHFQRIAVIGLCILVLFFLWMDIQLYYKVQNTDISTFPPQDNSDEQQSDQLFSPFNEFSVKLVMLDQADTYIHSPIAEAFEHMTNFAQTFPWISPNMISAAGVLFACIAARLVVIDNIYMHRLSVVVFQVSLVHEFFL